MTAAPSGVLTAAFMAHRNRITSIFRHSALLFRLETTHLPEPDPASVGGIGLRALGQRGAT